MKTLILPTMAIPAFKQFGIEFHTSITSLTLVIFIILMGIIYLLFKHKNKGCQQIQLKKDEGVLQLGQGGVI